jgi:hypothetical protein
MTRETRDLMSSGTYFLVHTLATQGALVDSELGKTAAKVTDAWIRQAPYEGMLQDVSTLAQRAGDLR